MILKNLVIRNNKRVNLEIRDNVFSRIWESGDKQDEIENEINLAGCIGFPGLFNSHDHLEFNLYQRLGHRVYEDYVEWGNDIHEKDKAIIDEIQSVPFAERVKAGILKNLISGVTHVAHHGNVYLPQSSPIEILQDCTNIHSVRLEKKWKMEIIYPTNLEPYVFHIGEGTNEKSHKEIDELIKWNVFRRKLFGVHAIAMDSDQSKNFESIIWCPEANYFLFKKTADIKNLKLNTKILFGTDSTLTSGWNIFDQIRFARESGQLTDDELMDSLTCSAADIWKVNSGAIEINKFADLVVAPHIANSYVESFFAVNAENMLLILNSGSVVLFDESLEGKFKDVDSSTMGFNTIEIGTRKKFIRLDIGRTIDLLKKYNPLF